MKTVFLIFMFWPLLASAQDNLAQQAFGPFNSHWRGVFKVYNYDGKLVNEIEVEQKYWWEGGIQRAEFVEKSGEGEIITAQARNYVKDGTLYCEVEKDTGEKSVHTGRLVDGYLFWYRKDDQKNIVESFKEYVASDSESRVYHIDGIGVYGSGAGASYLIFEGRYREVPK